MGVYLAYYSLPQNQLDQFLRGRDEEQIFKSLIQEHRAFPYTLHHVDVYAYGAIHRLLVPGATVDPLLSHVVEGAYPFALAPDQDANSMYLHQPRYLDSSTVKRLTDAMLAIRFDDLIERFATMEHLTYADDVIQVSQHPDFQPIMAEFERLLCFFHITATLDRSIIRWYSG
jgi:hypothetical protein